MTTIEKLELSPSTTHERFDAIVAGLGHVAGRVAPLTEVELVALEHEREDSMYDEFTGNIVLSVN